MFILNIFGHITQQGCADKFNTTKKLKCFRTDDIQTQTLNSFIYIHIVVICMNHLFTVALKLLHTLLVRDMKHT